MQIIPIKKPHYDCYDTVLATVMNACKRDHTLIFSNYLYLNYKKKIKNQSISDNISFHLPNKSTHILCKYCGVRYEPFCDLKDGSLVDRLILSLATENKPILLTSDIFNCSWNVLYQKRHMVHYFLAVGFDENNIICYDPYFTTEILSIPFTTINSIVTEASVFIIEQLPIVEKNEVVQLLLQGITDYTPYDIDSIRFFQDDILNMDISHEKTFCASEYDIPLVRTIQRIEFHRLCFLEMVEKLSIAYNWDSKDLLSKLNELANYWLRLKQLVHKSFVQNKIDKNKESINNYFNLIYSHEGTLKNTLQSIYFDKIC